MVSVSPPPRKEDYKTKKEYENAKKEWEKAFKAAQKFMDSN